MNSEAINQTCSTYITGAEGLIGSALSRKLGVTSNRLDVTKNVGWEEAFKGKQSVIHAAALSSSRGIDPDLVKAVNLDGTRRIAKIALDCGVKRFLFLSSVKVFGESTRSGERFSDQNPLNPGSVYASSKAKAEEVLWHLNEPGNFEIVIIRPTVVISPQSKGAVAAMFEFARKGYPFPVPFSGNQRDFVTIDNLVDAILCTLDHPESGGKAFSVTDGTVISTGELFLAMAEAQKRKGRLIKFPGEITRTLAKWIGKDGMWKDAPFQSYTDAIRELKSIMTKYSIKA